MPVTALALVSTTSVWGPQLPTPVTQAMFWLEKSPGPVKTQTVELQEHGVEMTQPVRVLAISKELCMYKK